MYGSSGQKEEHGVQNNVASEEAGPESAAYHWPDRANGDNNVLSKNYCAE